MTQDQFQQLKRNIHQIRLDHLNVTDAVMQIGSDVEVLKSDVKSLKADVTDLKTDVAEIKNHLLNGHS